MTVSSAQARLGGVVDIARVERNLFYLPRRGERVAAVTDAEGLDRLIAAAEHLAGIEAAGTAGAEIDDGDLLSLGRK